MSSTLYSHLIEYKKKRDLEGLLSFALMLSTREIIRKGITYYEKTSKSTNIIDLGGTVLVDFGNSDSQVTFPVIYCNFCNNTRICYHVIAATLFLFEEN